MNIKANAIEHYAPTQRQAVELPRMRLVIGLLAGGLTVAAAQSPPPPPSPTKTAQIKQNIGGVKNSPTQSATAIPQIPATVINQPSAAPTKTETTKKGDTNSNKAPFNWSNLLTVIFTGVLTWVGIMQWLSMRKQADYMRRELPVSIKAARSARFNAIAAQNAVKLAERNTTVTERAVVVIDRVVALPERPPDQDYFQLSSLITASVKNFGNTLAKNVKLAGEMKYQNKSFAFRDLPETTIAPQGVGQWITLSLKPCGVSSEDLYAINTTNNFFTFDILVTYKDVFENPYEYRVEGLYIPLLRGFIITNSA